MCTSSDLTIAAHAANRQSPLGNPAVWYGLYGPVAFCTATVMWFGEAFARDGLEKGPADPISH